MNENKAKVWIARQQGGSLRLYTQKPKKEINGWTSNSASLLIYMYSFPSVKWEDDEPTEAYITLAEPQEQPKQEHPTPKQEIDWEQRRYEIVKSIAAAIYSRPTVKTALLNVNQIISAADAIINELKKESK